MDHINQASLSFFLWVFCFISTVKKQIGKLIQCRKYSTVLQVVDTACDFMVNSTPKNNSIVNNINMCRFDPTVMVNRGGVQSTWSWSWSGLFISILATPRSSKLPLVPWRPASSFSSTPMPLTFFMTLGVSEFLRRKKESPTLRWVPKHSLTNLWWYTGGLLRKAQVEEFYVITGIRQKSKFFRCQLEGQLYHEGRT